jgi:hypothetical protein
MLATNGNPSMDNVQSSRSNQRLLPLRHRAADRKRLALRFNPCNLSELRLQAKRNLRPLARQNCCNVAGSFIPLCLRVYDVRIRGETHHNEAARGSVVVSYRSDGGRAEPRAPAIARPSIMRTLPILVPVVSSAARTNSARAASKTATENV